MIKKISVVAVLAIMTSVLVSCSGKVTEAPTAVAEVEETDTSPVAPAVPDVTSQPEKSHSDFVMPDTGKRPFAVMIDNEGARVLPQGGLDKAQVIYEILVEGGETRLMPVFWGTAPEMIGPVRSSRHYFLDYSMENDAIYVHYGWSYIAERDIKSLKINNINGVGFGGEIYWDLTNDRNNWQDSYTSMERILAFVSKAKYRTDSDKTPVFNFDETFAGLTDGDKAEKISIKYSAAVANSYEYDSTKKTYLRFRKGKAHMERVSGKQLEAVNIIIQFNKSYPIEGDDAGRINVETTGNGKGYCINQGKVINIKWSKADRKSATKYTDEAGNAIKLKPGATWVQVVPLNAKIQFE
jgi:hypothetical protein